MRIEKVIKSVDDRSNTPQKSQKAHQTKYRVIIFGINKYKTIHQYYCMVAQMKGRGKSDKTKLKLRKVKYTCKRDELKFRGERNNTRGVLNFSRC